MFSHSDDKYVQKIQVIQSRLQASQFVLSLNPRTLLPIELAAPAIGKSSSTFRSDLVRRPDALPRVTRRHGRVFVKVGDLINWLDARPPEQVATDPDKLRRGRPTKAVQIARQQVAEQREREATTAPCMRRGRGACHE